MKVYKCASVRCVYQSLFLMTKAAIFASKLRTEGEKTVFGTGEQDYSSSRLFVTKIQNIMAAYLLRTGSDFC